MNILTFLKYLRGIFNINLKSGTVHSAVIESIYKAFVMVDGDIDLMRLEMCLSTATGKWLDYWGDFFTVHRKLNEEDKPYAKRIIEYVIRPKTTIPAIKSYIVDFLNEEYHTEYTSDDVIIKEPWKELGKLSHKGTLSNDARFFSGDYWCHSVLDISIPEKLTQDLIDLVLDVKAAGVKIVWSFLNSYDIVTGFNEANDAWANYIRRTQLYVPRVTYSGLMLSNTSLQPTLSGRRELWFWMTNQYYMYAYMHDWETDKSEVITPLDLAGLLEYYEVIESVFTPKDTGLEVSNSTKGIMDQIRHLSGAKTDEEVVTHMIKITDDMLQSIQAVEDWMRLSQSGALSNDGVLFDFRPAHDLFKKIMDTVAKFKEQNPKYYDALQGPIVSAEHMAMWYVARHKNWLFDTPTMKQSDFYELWEMDDDFDHNTYDDITRFEDQSGDKYLTFGDVYQPPIVIAGSPWDWTPIIFSQWLWSSATLTNEELEEIYRMKFSGFPDMVTIETEITTHPENNLTLSGNGALSPQKYNITKSLVRNPEASMVMSNGGTMSGDKVISGAKVEEITEYNVNPEFDHFTYLSGDESIITKRRVVQENTPTLGTIIDFEENQCENGYVWNPNEDINFSTRDWFQAPVQIGIYALWLVVAHEHQLWNTPTATNEEIEGYWDSPDGNAALDTLPDDFVKSHISNSTIYQPPIVIADSPFYWTTRNDIPWLWLSATLTNEELEEIYLRKFGDNPTVFPDLVEVIDVAHKTPENEFRLSDNAYMNNNHVEVTVERFTHPENSFTMSGSGVLSDPAATPKFLSGSETLTITTTTLIEDGLGTHLLSGDKTTYSQEVTVREHTPTLGRLIELEEKQAEVIYSTRDWLQSPIIIGEYLVQWLVTKLNDQLWDSPTIANKEILYYCEGDDKPLTVTKLKSLIMNDPIRYQPPIECTEEVDYWRIKPNNRQLWNTPTITNEEIFSYWEGADKPTMLEFEYMHLMDTKIYQPPIMIADRPFYWLNDHVEYDTGWLWSSMTLTNRDLETLYTNKFGEPLTLGRLMELEEKEALPYSHRDSWQSPLVIVENYTIELPTNEVEQPWLWSSQILTNSELNAIYENRVKRNNPTLEQIMTIEESSESTVSYSTRGNEQLPIQIIESS